MKFTGETQIGAPGGSSIRSKVADNVNFKLGDLEFFNQQFVVMPQSKNLSYFEFDGVIGSELFSRFIVDINYENKLITLTEPAEFKLISDYEEIKIEFNMGYPMVNCSVEMESGVVIPLNMVFDLGAGHTAALNLGSEKDIVLPSKNIKTSVGRSINSELFGYQGRVKSFTIGQNTFNDVIATFNEKAMTPFERNGNLGSGIMNRFNLIFDYGNRKLYIKPNKFFSDPFEINMAGIKTSKTAEGLLRIERFMPNSAGKEAGLITGDIILKINNRRVEQIEAGEIVKLFEKENQVVELEIKRGESIKKVPIKLRRII